MVHIQIMQIIMQAINQSRLDSSVTCRRLHLRLCLWIVSRAAVLEAHFVESFAFEGKKNLLV